LTEAVGKKKKGKARKPSTPSTSASANAKGNGKSVISNPIANARPNPNPTIQSHNDQTEKCSKFKKDSSITPAAEEPTRIERVLNNAKIYFESIQGIMIMHEANAVPDYHEIIKLNERIKSCKSQMKMVSSNDQSTEDDKKKYATLVQRVEIGYKTINLLKNQITSRLQEVELLMKHVNHIGLDLMDLARCEDSEEFYQEDISKLMKDIKSFQSLADLIRKNSVLPS